MESILRLLLLPKIIFISAVIGISSGCLFSSHMADFPWIARIVVQQTSKQLCIGNLITEHFVMAPVNCYRRWSTLPKDYYSAKDLVIIAGLDHGEQNYCSQERPGEIVSAHPNYTSDPHLYNIAMMEVNYFHFNLTAVPSMPFLQSEKENVAALLKIQKDKPACDVPTFKRTKYMRNLIEDRDAMAVEIIDADECWNKYCPRGHKACLPFFDKYHYVCAQFVKPEKRCERHDLGAPLVCNNVSVGFLKICRDQRPMLFQSFNDKIVDSMLTYYTMGEKFRPLIIAKDKMKKQGK